MLRYDKIIIGAGLYGLYSALFSAKLGQKVIVLEYDEAPFKRATYINQARVHMGYHYPRSLSTAMKSASYFNRFNEDYGFCIHSSFDKIYATSRTFSWTNANQFFDFCKVAGIKCEEVSPKKYFRDDMVDGAFLTKEYTYDAHILRDYFLSELEKYKNVEIIYNARIKRIIRDDDAYKIFLESFNLKGEYIRSDFVLNATYASVNQILEKLECGISFPLKYELCEIILCEPNDNLKNVGITVMDGPFFSIMPFGKTGVHSLTAVTFTPHKTSFDKTPVFKCQQQSGGYCTPEQLGNCNSCSARPESSFDYMSGIANKYLNENYSYRYKESLFSMKPILVASEIDDSRPTVIKKISDSPTFISVLSGKINTVYDLDEVLR